MLLRILKRIFNGVLPEYVPFLHGCHNPGLIFIKTLKSYLLTNYKNVYFNAVFVFVIYHRALRASHAVHESFALEKRFLLPDEGISH